MYKRQNYTSTARVNINNSIDSSNNFSKTYTEKSTHTSSEFSSRNSANQHYNDNRYKLRNDEAAVHKKDIKNSISTYLNNHYGYQIRNTKDYFRILGKKKHPEYAKHTEAYNESKQVFAKMKSNEPFSKFENEFTNVVAYFEDVVTRYPGPKKKDKKIRYASYYNLAKLYYYLDNVEKTKEYGQKIIDNDHSKFDGKTFIRMSNSLDKLFKANKTKSRHRDVVTNDLAVGSESIEEEEIETEKAYLILRTNDTLTIGVTKSNVNSIGKSLKMYRLNEDGTIKDERVYDANLCKELIFLNGTHYKTISFKNYTSSNNSGITTIGPSPNLCKVVYESDKLSLYSFNDQEPVLFIKGEKNGKSTKSPKFVFGVNKSLMKYAEGCSSLTSKLENKEFKNTFESLTMFCKELNSCK